MVAVGLFLDIWYIKILGFYIPSLVIKKRFFQNITLTVQFNQLIYAHEGEILPYSMKNKRSYSFSTVVWLLNMP